MIRIPIGSLVTVDGNIPAIILADYFAQGNDKYEVRMLGTWYLVGSKRVSSHTNKTEPK
jgi:hypothetical protein